VRGRSSIAALLGLALVRCGGGDEAVSIDGYRGVRIGMSVEEASTAYGGPLLPLGPVEAGAGCFYVFPRGAPGAVSFMVVDGRVARVDVGGPEPRTSTGVGVGSTEAEVQAAYPGGVAVSPHKYTGPDGHYLTVAPREGAALIFETDGGKVTRYRAGNLPPVAYVEGCG
jgi:hypothetical protein